MSEKRNSQNAIKRSLAWIKRPLWLWGNLDSAAASNEVNEWDVWVSATCSDPGFLELRKIPADLAQ